MSSDSEEKKSLSVFPRDVLEVGERAAAPSDDHSAKKLSPLPFRRHQTRHKETFCMWVRVIFLTFKGGWRAWGTTSSSNQFDEITLGQRVR